MNEGYENINQKKCPNCGATAGTEAIFCCMCGTKMEMQDQPRFCSQCAAPLEVNAAFCSNCGNPVNTVNAQPVQSPVSKPKRKKKKSRYSIPVLIRNCLMVAMAILVTVFTFFNVVTYDMSLLGMDFSVKLSPIRNVILMTDALKNYDDEELLESDIYDELESTATEFAEDIVGFDASALGPLFGMQAQKSTDFSDQMAYDYYYGDQYTDDTAPAQDDVYDDSYEDFYDSYEDFYSSGDLYDYFEDYSVKLTSSQQKLLDKIMFLSIRLAAQSEDSGLTPIGVAAALGSILQIALCVAFLVFSVLNLVFYLLGKKAPKKTAIRLMATIPLIALLNYFATINWMTLEGAQMFKVTIGTAVLVPLIAGVVTVLACVVLNIVTEYKHYTAGKVVARSISFAVAVLTLCMIFAPVMKTTVDTTFFGGRRSEAKTYIYSDYFESLNMGEDQYDIYKEQKPQDGKISIADNIASFEMYSKSQVRDGDAKHLDYQILTEAFAGLGGSTLGLVGLFSLVHVLMYIAALAAALVAWQTACYFLMGRSTKPLVLVAKIVGTVCAVAAFAIIIVFVCIVNYNLEEFGFSNYSASFSAASLIFVLASVATASVPLLKDKRNGDGFSGGDPDFDGFAEEEVLYDPTDIYVPPVTEPSASESPSSPTIEIL